MCTGEAMQYLNDEITIVNGELTKVITKDIPLMSKDSTFSSMLKGISDFYLLNVLQEIEKRDLHKEEAEEDEVETISLF